MDSIQILPSHVKSAISVEGIIRIVNTRICREAGYVANTRFFGFVLSRLLRRHLGFDSDFAQISGQKLGG